MPEVIHVFSEQDSKGSLLAEVHRLQTSLAAMRQARDFHGANSAELMRERDRLQREIEKMSKLREAAPAPVDAGLVERMLGAWAHGDGDIKLDAINVLRMTAALRVAADALLAELRRTLKAQTTLPNDHIAAITNTIRARLSGRLRSRQRSG